jgi:hypothetical protein
VQEKMGILTACYCASQVLEPGYHISQAAQIYPFLRSASCTGKQGREKKPLKLIRELPGTQTSREIRDEENSLRSRSRGDWHLEFISFSRIFTEISRVLTSGLVLARVAPSVPLKSEGSVRESGGEERNWCCVWVC